LSAINSVHEFCKLSHEIIVVDNNSMDGSADEIKRLHPEVIIKENKTNVGFSAANNQGFSVAKGEYILMLNPDAELLDTNLNKAIEYIDQSTHSVLLGPRIQNPDATLQTSAWKFQNAFAHFLEAFFLNKLISPNNYALVNFELPTTVDSISGACILMKKKVIDEIGGLDNRLFWMDDVDLCFRINTSGGSVCYFPAWRVKHYIGESSKKNLAIVIANQLISKLKFYKKHKQYFNFGLSILFIQIHILLRILFLAPLSMVSKDLFQKWKAYLYTQKRFYQYLLLNKQSVS